MFNIKSVGSNQIKAMRHYSKSALTTAKLTLQGLSDKVDLKGKNVLVRVDLNVPLDKKVSKREADLHCIRLPTAG